MKINSYGEQFDVYPVITEYSNNGNLAIVLIDRTDDAPFGNLTVNTDQKLPPGFACIDVNNIQDAESMIKNYQIGKPTSMMIRSGFVCYPVYQFDLEALKRMDPNQE